MYLYTRANLVRVVLCDVDAQVVTCHTKIRIYWQQQLQVVLVNNKVCVSYKKSSCIPAGISVAQNELHS